MLYINIIEDEELQESLEKVVSGLIAHEKYDATFYLSILQEITRYIKIEEMSGEYHILFNILDQIRKIGYINSSYVYKVSREVVDSSVKSNILDIIKKPEIRIEELLLLEGYDTNLAIEKNLNNACILLHKRTLELYDRLMELKTPSEEALSYIIGLRANFIRHVGEYSINVQARILNGKIRIGRKIYSGSDDWRIFNTELNTTLNTRLNDELAEGITLNSVETGDIMLDKLANLYKPLAEYGLPPLDDKTPILAHRLVIVVANENVGKTKFAINTAVNMIREGKRVVYMCGETTDNMIYAMVLSNYIYKEYNLFITTDMLANRDKLPEDKQKIVKIASAKLSGSGLLHLEPMFNYDTIYEDLENIYNINPFDGVFIDHTLALVGTGTEYDNIGKLAKDLREFKRNHPVYIQALSHPSSIAKDLLIKGKDVEAAPTRGNAQLAAEADEILILITNKTLEKQNLLAIQNYKRRNAGKVTDIMIVQKRFNVASFYWDERLQSQTQQESISNNEALKIIQDEYEDDEDEDEDFEEL